jgi:hypothetical protein
MQTIRRLSSTLGFDDANLRLITSSAVSQRQVAFWVRNYWTLASKSSLTGVGMPTILSFKAACNSFPDRLDELESYEELQTSFWQQMHRSIYCIHALGMIYKSDLTI